MVTSTLDLLGALLIILAVAWLVAAWTISGAFAVAGVLLLLLSLLIDRKGAR